jgi:hypothetical protein
VHFSVLVNASPSGFFTSSCGLRKGNPLSLLPFINVMEALSKMIFATVDGGFLSSFSVGSRNFDMLYIFHFLFVDDIIIFCEGLNVILWSYIGKMSSLYRVGNL